MTRSKGLRSLLSFKSFGHGRHHNHRPSSAAATASAASSSSSSSSSMMEDAVASAEEIVVKWDPDASAYAKITSLFYEDRSEAHRFLSLISDLQRAMLAFVAAADHLARLSPPCLVRAQTLMQAAMRRLDKEFYQILAANRDLLDPESVSVRSSVSDDPDFDPSYSYSPSPEVEALAAGDSITAVERAAAVVMADLHAIADTMVFAGYGKECVRTYKTLRKSIVDEGLYRLGFERFTPAQLKRLDWAVLELKIGCWLGAARVAVRTLFHGERVLVDHVFAGSDAVREAVFSDIVGDAAAQFLRFPASVARSKRSPDKLFRLLDLYDTVTELSPEVDLVFSFESTAAIRAQALASLSKLAEAARPTLADFESTILKESSRSPVPGGDVHPMTRYAMNYISLLSDYEFALAEIFTEFPLNTPSSIPAFFFDTQEPAAQPAASGTSSAIAPRFAWVVFALLCKLDGKAEAYRDVGLSFLFLANNLHYIVNKVRSCRLRGLLGEEWAARQAAKSRQHAAGYERVAWGHVAAAVPAGEVSAGEVRERMRAFSAALEEACAGQVGWVVADAGMREEVREAVRGMVVPAYRGFYLRWQGALEDAGVLRLSPDDVRERLGELFSGSEYSGSVATGPRLRPGPCH